MALTQAPLVIATLRGGLNNVDPPIALPDDQVVLSENIDYERSTLGGRRRGQAAISTSGSTLTTACVFLGRHLPTPEETASTLWATSVSGANSVWNYKDTTWHAVVPTDALAVSSGQYAIRSQTIHGKFFLAYPLASGVDRLMVYDGTSLRRTGLREPAAAPTVTDSGSGSFTGTRYYRTRFYAAATLSGYTRMSEPSDATTFVPSGTGAGATVSRPTVISEGETAWIVEESLNNADFYQIATVPIATTTYVDTNATTAIANFTLSPAVGTYSLQYSPKFLLADQDRLIMGGSWQQPALASRMSWTPVYAAPGVGNDERLDENQDPFLDCDNYDGGQLTDGGGPVNGYIYVFKWQRIFKMIRTGNVKQAYQAIKITSAKGAFPRSVVPGFDEAGRECLYFLDPHIGPSRISGNGLESCGKDITGTWDRVNQNAALVSHGLFYPKRRQVHWWVALDGATTPTTRIVAFVESFTPSVDGVRRGWSTWTGVRQQTLASVMYADNIDANTTRSLALKPYTATSGSMLISQEDTGTNDNGTLYQARQRTKPFDAGQMVMRTGIRAGALMATTASGVSVGVTLIRNYGQETATPVSVSLTPAGTEDHVTKQIDNVRLTDLLTLQVELGDLAPADVDWVLDKVSFIPSAEEAM